jgi:hypothetical protein
VKIILIGIVSGVLCLGGAMAQSGGNTIPASSPESLPQTQPGNTTPAPQQTPTGQTTAPQAQAAQTGASARSGQITRIAPGSVIPVSLTKTIDAKKAKTGEEVVAKVTQDMKSTDGEVIVAKDTKVMGHVTEAQARNKEQKESELGIAFDHAVTKDGRTLTMPMSIQAIVGAQNNNNAAQNNQSSASAPEPSAPSSSGNSRSAMGGSSAQNQPTAGGGTPSDTSTPARPPINAQTQGVIGISDLALTSTAANAGEGSVMTSEKNNVKIEGGTMLLLRVSQ